MKLAVDWTRCDAHGSCAQLLPEAIGVDENGFPVLSVERLTEHTDGEIRRAVAFCPALALYVD